MWHVKLVGMTESTHDTRDQAVAAFAIAEAAGRTYGNRYVKGPNGETVNVWDIL